MEIGSRLASTTGCVKAGIGAQVIPTHGYGRIVFGGVVVRRQAKSKSSSGIEAARKTGHIDLWK